MTVCYHGPRQKPGATYAYFADLETMARGCDCLVVSCASTPATRNLIDERILHALGADGFLVNVARGAVVDEQALIAALRGGHIAGAGLDVFWDEPRVPAELAAMDKVVLVPHIGSNTLENREERSAMLLASVRAHFTGAPVPSRLV
jgi:lactate dehydrogenase-like 2-hydroxyacid dehydrogenase